MSGTHRRQFLQAVAATGLGLQASLSARPARAIDPIGRTRPSHLKLSIAAYSYRQLLTGNTPRMTLFDFANLAADMGLDAIEPTSYYFPPDVDAAYLHRLRQHAFRLGLDISGTAIGNNFALPPGPARDEQLDLTRRWIDHAATLTAPVIRIFAGSVPRDGSESQAIAHCVECIEAVLPYAAERGIALALENHGGITSTADQILAIVEAVRAPDGNFGINFDSGNFHTDDPYADLARIAPYAVNAQVKVEIQRRGQAKEPADLPRIIGILREAKYSGHIALEYEAENDPLEAIPGIIRGLRPLLA
jgi:sugar phosphate isomerase/epimerase